MIKTYFIVFWCTIACISTATACDSCGCPASGVGIGIMTDYRSNFIRMSYTDTRFGSSPEHGHNNATDIFSSVGIAFRYSISRYSKLRLSGELPYGINTRTSSGKETSIHGLSDARLVVSHALLDIQSTSRISSLYVEAGAGVSIPTGKYNEDIAEEDLPENFNLGIGSWGYIFQLNSVWNHGRFGLLMNTNYQINDRTDTRYHFGNQFTSQVSMYREFSIGKVSLIPSAGLYYEHISSDINKYDNRVPETGGDGLYVSTSLNFKMDKVFAGLSYLTPIHQNYSGGAVDAQSKVAVHFSFLF